MYSIRIMNLINFMYLITFKIYSYSDERNINWHGGLFTFVTMAPSVRGSNPGGARFSAPVQTGSEAHPVSCKMGTGYFPGVSCDRGVTLTPHPLLVPRSKIE
jgi:hypothetical protein